MPTTRILLSTGDWIEVDGSEDDVRTQLEDATRSTSGTLAWLREADSDHRVGINPAQFVLLRPGDD